MQRLYNTKDRDYVIDVMPEHNVTVARMLCCKDIVEDAVHKISIPSLMILSMLTHIDGMTDPAGLKIKAIAKCSGENEFDESIGTEIAVCRAERKYYRKRSSEYRRYAELLKRAAKDLSDLSEANAKKAEGQKRSEEYLLAHIP